VIKTEAPSRREFLSRASFSTARIGISRAELIACFPLAIFSLIFLGSPLRDGGFLPDVLKRAGPHSLFLLAYRRLVFFLSWFQETLVRLFGSSAGDRLRLDLLRWEEIPGSRLTADLNNARSMCHHLPLSKASQTLRAHFGDRFLEGESLCPEGEGRLSKTC